MEENKNEEYIYHNGIAYASDRDQRNIDKEKKKKEKDGNYWFTGLQAVVCIMILLSALVLKGMGGKWYTEVKTWYKENLVRSILIEYNPAEIKQEVFEWFAREEGKS